MYTHITRSHWNRLIVVTFLAGSLFIAATRAGSEVAGAGSPAPAAALESAPLVDHLAPDFTLESLDGTRVTLADLRGSVVLINVWATWCPPCRSEMPAIQHSYDQFRSNGFVVLAVNMGEGRDTVAGYMREQGLNFPALLDTDGAVSAVYQARALPSSFFVDRRGVIRAVYRGPMPRGVIDGMVAQLLAEKP